MKYKLNYKIDFSKLPYKGNKIDWNNTIGMKVYFTDENGKIDYFYIQSIEYIKGTNKIKAIHTDYHGYNYHISRQGFLESRISYVVGRMVHGYKYKIGDIIDNRIEIINMKKEKMGVNIYNKYKYKCRVCGNVDWITENVLVTKKTMCNVCAGLKVKIGFNDIPTTNPWMIDYFQGGYEEAKQYTCNGQKKLYFKCPDCGRIKKKLMSINQLYRRRGIGCSCGDGYSYPNKFMYSFLEQIGIDFINEYSPKWISPKRYDFYIPSKNLIIEMDGDVGHGNDIYDKNRNSILIDKYKEDKAKENNIEVIRINASKSEKKYLYQNIKNSNIFSKDEINNVDINQCDNFACCNMVKYVCDVYEELKPISYRNLARKLKLPYSTTHSYLKKGKELSICSYDGKEYTPVNKIKVVCFDGDMNLLKIYDSAKEAEEITGVHGVSACCRGERKTAGGFIWKRYDDIQEVINL